jgi:hypothetical protein
MIIRDEFLDKTDNQGRCEGKRESMKNKSTYKLLMQSEEKSRNILETVIYGLVALSVVVSIWQFAEQPMPATDLGVARQAKVQIAS